MTECTFKIPCKSIATSSRKKCPQKAPTEENHVTHAEGNKKVFFSLCKEAKLKFRIIIIQQIVIVSLSSLQY